MNRNLNYSFDEAVSLCVSSAKFNRFNVQALVEEKSASN